MNFAFVSYKKWNSYYRPITFLARMHNYRYAAIFVYLHVNGKIWAFSVNDTSGLLLACGL
jgi:hypothetical protein